jgi:hypothetical protein
MLTGHPVAWFTSQAASSCIVLEMKLYLRQENRWALLNAQAVKARGSQAAQGYKRFCWEGGA